MLDRAYGCLLGGAVGDAAGAVLEFLPHAQQQRLVEHALSMPGGGVHRVGRGQVTDDSELAMALATALAGTDPSEGLPTDRVALAYRQWARSEPFDMGNTCRAAFLGGRGKASAGGVGGGGVAAQMMAASASASPNSEANGALMRIAPLALWGAALPPEQLAAAARSDARLSHPSRVCQDANAVYTAALAHLVLHPGDAEGAIARAERMCTRHPADGSDGGIDPAVAHWLLHDSRATPPPRCASASAGHVRWGFVLAFAALRARTQPRAALASTLAAGGDTDTNAAIVGAMAGALHGASAIPEDISAPVLAFDPSTAAAGGGGHRRPSMYAPSRLEALSRTLLRDEAV